MTKNDMIEALADYFGFDYPDVDPDTGEYDLGTYDWEAGCYAGDAWMSLKNVVYALEDLCEEEEE